MRRSIFVSMVVVLLAVPVFAGPLMKEQVSSTANWVVHCDYEQFKSSLIGQLIRQGLANKGIEAKLENFAKVFSFHPIDDIRDVTIYGNGHDRQKAVVLIDGNFDEEKLLALVRLNAHHEEIEHGDIILHQWLEKKKGNKTKSQMMYGCLYNSRLVIMSAGLDAIRQAVDVLKGSAGNAAGDMFNQPALNAEGAFFQVAANDVAQMAKQQAQTAGLRQTDKLGLVIGETDGNFYIDLGLIAKSQEAAININKILDGMIALTALAGQEQPMLAELAQTTQLSCQDNEVQVHFELDSESVFQFLKEQWEKKVQQKSQEQ